MSGFGSPPVRIDNATIERVSGVLQLKDAGIATAKLAAATITDLKKNLDLLSTVTVSNATTAAINFQSLIAGSQYKKFIVECNMGMVLGVANSQLLAQVGVGATYRTTGYMSCSGGAFNNAGLNHQLKEETSGVVLYDATNVTYPSAAIASFLLIDIYNALSATEKTSIIGNNVSNSATFANYLHKGGGGYTTAEINDSIRLKFSGSGYFRNGTICKLYGERGE